MSKLCNWLVNYCSIDWGNARGLCKSVNLLSSSGTENVNCSVHSHAHTGFFFPARQTSAYCYCCGYCSGMYQNCLGKPMLPSFCSVHVWLTNLWPQKLPRCVLFLVLIHSFSHLTSSSLGPPTDRIRQRNHVKLFFFSSRAAWCSGIKPAGDCSPHWTQGIQWLMLTLGVKLKQVLG